MLRGVSRGKKDHDQVRTSELSGRRCGQLRPRHAQFSVHIQSYDCLLMAQQQLHLSSWQRRKPLHYATEPVWAQNPDSLPTKVYPSHNQFRTTYTLVFGIISQGPQSDINLLAPELFFLILAHPVYKMWIIQESNTLELWNKLHFEEKKNGEYIPCLKYSVDIFVE